MATSKKSQRAPSSGPFDLLSRLKDTPWQTMRFYGLCALLFKSEALLIMFMCFIDDVNGKRTVKTKLFGHFWLGHVILLKPLCALINDRLAWFIAIVKHLMSLFYVKFFGKDPKQKPSPPTNLLHATADLQTNILFFTEGTIVVTSIAICILVACKKYEARYTQWLILILGVCLVNSAACAEGFWCKCSRSSDHFSPIEYTAMRLVMCSLYGISSVLCTMYALAFQNTPYNSLVLLVPLVLISNSSCVLWMLREPAEILKLVDQVTKDEYPLIDKDHQTWNGKVSPEDSALGATLILWSVYWAKNLGFKPKSDLEPIVALGLLLASQVAKLVSGAVCFFVSYHGLSNYCLFLLLGSVSVILGSKKGFQTTFARGSGLNLSGLASYAILQVGITALVQLATSFAITSSSIATPSGFETVAMCLVSMARHSFLLQKCTLKITSCPLSTTEVYQLGCVLLLLVFWQVAKYSAPKAAKS